MSETTKNIGLFLGGDPTTKFHEWRKSMNDVTNSNMTKIDDEFGKKANHSKSVTGTLLASAWAGVDAPFTQALAVDDLGAAQNGRVDLAQTATFEERQMAREAMLCVTGQEAGKLMISADGEMPDIDIPVVVTLID